MGAGLTACPFYFIMIQITTIIKSLLDKTTGKVAVIRVFFIIYAMFGIWHSAIAQQTYPKLTGYVSITHPIGTWNKEAVKYNFKDDYTIIFPIGLNLMKSERFGFSFELSPAIKSDSNGTKVTSVLFHPGAVFKLNKGFGMAGRLAFETNGRFGFTPVLNKVIAKKAAHNYWLAVPFPVRFGNNQPTSIGMGLQFGVGF